MVSPYDVLLRVVEILDMLGIPYMVGGSFASSVHGIPRMTYDADLVAEIGLEHVAVLVANLQDEFYVDAEMIREAIQRQSPFNVIHLQSMFKVDVFPLKTRAFDQVEFARRRKERLLEDREEKVYVTTPEGIILSKLEWYRMGGEMSERQYRDVLGVIRQQNESRTLDWGYLTHWARELGLEDLLERAREDALGDMGTPSAPSVPSAPSA